MNDQIRISPKCIVAMVMGSGGLLSHAREQREHLLEEGVHEKLSVADVDGDGRLTAVGAGLDGNEGHIHSLTHPSTHSPAPHR